MGLVEKSVRDVVAAVRRGDMQGAASATIELVLDAGISGLPGFQAAEPLAADALSSCGGDVEAAIDRVVRTHLRFVAVSGFGTGFGGLVTLPLTLPADVTFFYMHAARMVAAIAALRGYDVHEEYVRSAVAVSLVGAMGTEAVAKLGVKAADKAGAAALKKVPGALMVQINQKVGFRLVTKAGQTGVVNLVKVIPVVAAGVGVQRTWRGRWRSLAMRRPISRRWRPCR